jgi:hypothetical protein
MSFERLELRDSPFAWGIDGQGLKSKRRALCGQENCNVKRQLAQDQVGWYVAAVEAMLLKIQSTFMLDNATYVTEKD